MSNHIFSLDRHFLSMVCAFPDWYVSLAQCYFSTNLVLFAYCILAFHPWLWSFVGRIYLVMKSIFTCFPSVHPGSSLLMHFMDLEIDVFYIMWTVWKLLFSTLLVFSFAFYLYKWACILLRKVSFHSYVLALIYVPLSKVLSILTTVGYVCFCSVEVIRVWLVFNLW